MRPEPAIERHEASHEQKRAESFHRKRKRNHDAQQRDDIQIAAAGAFAGEYKVANADAAADEQRETRCKRGKAEAAALNEHKQNALPEIRPVHKRIIHGKARDTRGGGRREKRVHRVCEPPAFRRDRQREQHGADKNKDHKADDEHARG